MDFTQVHSPRSEKAESIDHEAILPGELSTAPVGNSSFPTDPAVLWETLRNGPRHVVVDPTAVCKQHATTGQAQGCIDSWVAIRSGWLVRDAHCESTCWICSFVSRVCALNIHKDHFVQVWKEDLPLFVNKSHVDWKSQLWLRNVTGYGPPWDDATVEEPIIPGFDWEALEKVTGQPEIPGLERVHLFDNKITGNALGRLQPEREVLDLDLVGTWLRECDEGHRWSCFKAPALPPQEGLYLINVSTRLVELIDPVPEYVALSYVCGEGTGTTFDATSAGLPAHVGQAVEDAMAIVQGLGKRFLWVDAYCIENDDPVQRQRRIAQMDAIYECSYLTICVLPGGSITSGLPGMSRRFKGRSRISAEYEDKYFLALSFTAVPQIMETCAWGNRGWTLQEGTLSRRRLCLHDEGFFMLCRVAVFQDLLDHESGSHGQIGIDETLLPGFGLPWDSIVADEWSFAAYSKVVRSYCYRALTLQSDAINAVTGLFNRIHLPLDAHFFGLPRHDFHNSLLWYQDQELGSWNTYNRRQGYPSWSWLGWNTHVVYGAFLVPGLQIYATNDNTSEQIPLVHSVVYETSHNVESLLCKNLIMIQKHAVYQVDSTSFDLDHGVLRVSTDIATFSIKRDLPSDEEILRRRHRGNEIRGATYQLLSPDGQRLQQKPYYSFETGQLGDFTEAERMEIGLCDRYPGTYSFTVNESSLDSCTESLEFILLQYWVRHKDAQPPELLNSEGPPPQETLDHVARFKDRVYVMAIRRRPDGVAERVAVLWLHAEAWLAADPQPTTLRLG